MGSHFIAFRCYGYGTAPRIKKQSKPKRKKETNIFINFKEIGWRHVPPRAPPPGPPGPPPLATLLPTTCKNEEQDTNLFIYYYI
jgi:hypothetical protein